MNTKEELRKEFDKFMDEHPDIVSHDDYEAGIIFEWFWKHFVCDEPCGGMCGECKHGKIVAVLTPLKQARSHSSETIKRVLDSITPEEQAETERKMLSGEPGNEAKKGADLWQTVNPNKPHYAMSTNLTTEGMDVNWIDVWCEIENWYGDHKKRETAEQLLTRLQKKFNLTNHLKVKEIHYLWTTTKKH